MIGRTFWLRRIYDAWKRAPIVWLAGVRRAGKTTLARSLPDGDTRYLNCELPEAAELTRDPVAFFSSLGSSIVVLDEVHYLPDPARVLKIAADEFTQLKVLATGSSTLAASHKFRDTLTGRKRTVHLTPVLATELEAFGVGLEKRLYHGGLPAALLAAEKDPGFYREWLDSFFARDIQRLFAFRDVNKFSALFEYLLRQSGGLFELGGTARAVGVSRPTVESHIRALEATQAATLVRPFSGGGQNELLRMPKCYGFDTGFVSFCRGWSPLRRDDMGQLWEHVVLEFLQAYLPNERVQFWRDRAGREVDFVVARSRDRVDAIECKWSPNDFDASALKVFRQYYPAGRNYVLCPGAGEGYPRRLETLEVFVCGPVGWLAREAGAG